MLGTNQEYAKSYNLRIVLEAIRTNGPLSRADVARATRLTRQTISNIVDELLSQHLVSETGRQQGRRGTPATLLEFQPKAAYSIGFDLDQAHLTAVLMDLNGAVEVRYQERLNYPSPQESLEKMTHLTEQLLEQQNLPRSKICGVGIGVPGPMRMLDSAKDQRQVINPHGFPGWENTPIAEHLAERLDLPVQLENNATAAAIGESFYGAGQGLKHFFYVFLGMGLGGGLFIQGQPFHGLGGNAGEIGFLPIQNAGRYEQLGYFFSADMLFNMLRAQGHDIKQLEDLAHLLAQDDPDLLAWLDQAADHLARALLSVEYLVDPEALIVGGSWPVPVLEHLIQDLRQHINSGRIQHKSYAPELMLSHAGEDAAVLGVATLPIYHMLTPLHHIHKEAAPQSRLFTGVLS